MKNKKPLVWQLFRSNTNEMILLGNNKKGIPELSNFNFSSHTIFISKKRNGRTYNIFQSHHGRSFCYFIQQQAVLLNGANHAKGVTYKTFEETVAACNKHNNDNKKYIKDTNVG